MLQFSLVFDNYTQLELMEYGKLLEINSHSLFSKWFSESGKMVQKMFNQIWSMVEDENTFVVNALLTQIDRLKQRKNVLILTTSNITEAIDIAFIDRADIKIHVGLPSQEVIYTMLRSSIQELYRTGIIGCQVKLLDWRQAWRHKRGSHHTVNNGMVLSSQLMEVSELAQGMSGRAVRKLPFLAYAAYLQSPMTTTENFLGALRLFVHVQHSARQ
ncbi:Pachytene checkpoint protein 2 [Mortierella sp. GBA30]|nr:Pachytene checkpoint protein 2 [Mortierella sp. GBA30]